MGRGGVGRRPAAAFGCVDEGVGVKGRRVGEGASVGVERRTVGEGATVGLSSTGASVAVGAEGSVDVAVATGAIDVPVGIGEGVATRTAVDRGAGDDVAAGGTGVGASEGVATTMGVVVS